VTGGSGFIGAHLTRRLVQLGHAVTVIDLADPAPPVDGAVYVRRDVRELPLLAKLVDDCTAVYHLAATVSVPLSEQDPIASHANNVEATLGVLEVIRARNRAHPARPPTRLVFASSAAVYGARGDDGRALAEEDVAEIFSSHYAAQKHQSEQAIQLHGSRDALPALVFRLFNVFGPRQDPGSPYSGVISVFCRRAREGRPLALHGGGAQTRDFVSVHDVTDARAAALALPRDAWDARPVNLGSGKRTTIRELAERIVAAFGSRSAITPAARRDADVLHSLADISRARAVLGFEPRVDLSTGLRELAREAPGGAVG
jgi:UDP-glucose 4-epimerase